MKKIYFRLDGGLGNQMFEYAFLYVLVKRYNMDAKILCRKHYDLNEDFRVYALDCFNLSLKFDVVDEKIGLNYYTFLLFIRKVICRYFKCKNGLHNHQLLIRNGIYFSDNSDYCDIEKYICKKNTTLIYGYFQSYNYFDCFRQDILREFEINKNISSDVKELQSEINKCNSVCLHIRRGDYTNEYYSYLNVCDFQYYKNAVEYINDRIDNPVFYVFSNSRSDIEWIKNNYRFENYNVKYVNMNNKDYEDLFLMKNCKHFILSNSTFSWWGQYLCDNEDKIVISPSKWRKYEKNEFPLIMPNFKLIDVD